jgi:hypothetical protein
MRDVELLTLKIRLAGIVLLFLVLLTLRLVAPELADMPLQQPGEAAEPK